MDGNAVQNLLSYVDSCTSPYHTVDTSLQILLDAGFKELFLEDAWDLTPGDYVINVYGTTLVAFHIGEDVEDSLVTGPAGQSHRTLRIVSAHKDFPAIRVKPNPIVNVKGYRKLNVEMYGGLIMNTWLDRPLAVSGLVALKGENPYEVERVLVDTRRPIGIIPNLAIHMNRKVNEGVALNKQVDMLPLVMMDPRSGEDEVDAWLNLLAQEVDCDIEDILSYEMTLYPIEKGCTIGLEDEFVSAPRLDNLTSCLACLEGIQAAKKEGARGIRLAILFDNEEVGSRTKQGGASNLLPRLMERIYRSLGLSLEDLDRDMANGFMISSDVAHGLHPNHPEKNDITNEPLLNKGVALKTAASQSYAGDAVAVAVVKGLCQEYKIPCQHYVNRSDEPGGSTVGSISSAIFPMRTMDVGLPLLAMHSARETMGANDQVALDSLMKVFLGK